MKLLVVATHEVHDEIYELLYNGDALYGRICIGVGPFTEIKYIYTVYDKECAILLKLKYGATIFKH